MRHHRTRFTILVVALLLSTACAGKTPPNLTPAEAAAYRANQAAVEAVVVLGTIQHAAIELNKAQVCMASATTPSPCHPILTDANTRTVINVAQSSALAIDKTPDGWKALLNAALTQLSQGLDSAGKASLRIYIDVGQALLTAATSAQ